MKTPEKPSNDRNAVPYYGLTNQGATCYLNAVLQCLFMTEEFREEVLSYEDLGGKENILVELKRLFRKLSEKVATTEGITRSLGIRNAFEQQDAVEYYRKILKAIQPLASKVFEGKMSNVTKCGKCGKELPEINTFISILLSINVEDDKVYDVETGLKAFEEHSTLEEDDWVYCDKCDCKTKTETWSKIDEYPNVVTLHLKRFDFDYMQMRYEKNECLLDVPLTLPKKHNRPTYDLYAVINHKGRYSGGHYEAIIKSYENGVWYCFDDSCVTETSESPLKNSSLPYMLMYRKRVFSPASISHPLRILLTGPSRSGKSTVGNIILGGDYFPCRSGSETVTKECMVKTVEKVTVVDIPNLFCLNKLSWTEEIEKCVKLSDHGPNVILWVTQISEFTELQQGLFHSFINRLDSGARNHMMIVFTNGRELTKLGQNIGEFILKHSKLHKVVHRCQDRYHVIDINDGHNYTSELLEKLSEMMPLEEATALLRISKMLKTQERCFTKKGNKRLRSDSQNDKNGKKKKSHKK
ncbi:ubiquitin carboxyl-terminal hydrolase 47 [Danio aesculapii]|uniref:ubiquitin carboxyl-terminal hydrolase 47 n=1 Tax=Danio aesculapii TaxID=1142201 RepID=UPI0024BFE9B1|nr:ubiquitin carboxyl-terminal hydrolase 47 [Danio aesculapii]XP_056317143.1 ubiquitin carboxyl-terminal hydrolase 47 [Danio aesculapii]